MIRFLLGVVLVLVIVWLVIQLAPALLLMTMFGDALCEGCLLAGFE